VRGVQFWKTAIMTEMPELSVGQTLTGSSFHEPVRVETVSQAGAGSWVVDRCGHWFCNADA
jgi:hypothetical protein